MTHGEKDLALFLSGGGARCLPGGLPALSCQALSQPEHPLLTGVSAGAINAAFLVNHRGAFAEAVGELAEMWRGLTIDQVFGVDTWNLAKIVIRWGVSLAFGGLGLSPSVRGLVDTGPLHKLLQKRLASSSGILPGVGENLRQ